MIERLVIFGDSFAYGQGLDNRLEECYAARVAQHFGWELVNLGVPGGSQESSKWQLHEFQKQENSKSGNLILHGLSHPNRMSWIGNEHHRGFNCNLIPVTIGDYDQGVRWCNDLQKLWVKWCHSAEWEEYNDWHTVQVFNAFAHQTDQPMLQYYTYEYLNDLPGVSLKRPLIEAVQGLSLDMFFDHGHLTAEGNQVVADFLVDYIKQNVL